MNKEKLNPKMEDDKVVMAMLKLAKSTLKLEGGEALMIDHLCRLAFGAGKKAIMESIFPLLKDEEEYEQEKN